jgi:[ribosomal protein S18]-alanine N-acetyltransferase
VTAIMALDQAGVAVAALVHRAAVQAGEQWNEPAISALLALPGAFGFLAMGAGEAAQGFILARSVVDEVEIFYLAVRPEARRQGIGCRLLQAVMTESTRRGCRRLYLEVAVDNLPARTLYAAAGLSQIGRRAGYYQRTRGETVDALIMAGTV